MSLFFIHWTLLIVTWKMHWNVWFPLMETNQMICLHGRNAILEAQASHWEVEVQALLCIFSLQQERKSDEDSSWIRKMKPKLLE